MYYAGEKQTTPQKRPLEDNETTQEPAGKKMARVENGLNRELGEPEVEPTINGKDVHAEKTGVEVDTTTTETVAEKKEATDQGVTGEVAAV